MERINGNDLINLGFKENKSFKLALEIANQILVNSSKEKTLEILNEFILSPEKFKNDEIFSILFKSLVEHEISENEIELKPANQFYEIFGAEQIEEGAKKQMDIAMRLPITVGGALMPDAHQGYGLPIGGVLATKNSIIPYGVGVDIGCRMALSIYDINENFFYDNEPKFKRELIAWTRFGAGAAWHGKDKADHEILERNEFNINSLIKNLKDKAYGQLGTSGGGNHFVEFGIIEFEKDSKLLNIKAGRYLSLLTHSGSRGLGATIAGHYTKIAKEICKLPSEAKNLAYLDLNSAEGQEYWIAMNLAGDYASACHEIIHKRITNAIGAHVMAKVENHHNFAWKEKWNNEELIVHRKGATPAAEGVLGFIPGSMTAPGYLVVGKGKDNSINSASHGAGRQMSRTQAIKSIARGSLKKVLKEHGVTLIGAGLDEAPMAYKNIENVMAAQSDLVDVIAKFTPKMVRMADDGSRED